MPRIKILNLLMAVVFNFPIQGLIFTSGTVKAQNSYSSDISSTNKIIEINNLMLLGNTVFDDAELKRLLSQSSTQVRIVRIRELNKLTALLTDFYVSKGYISSGAFIPQQDISEGLIKVQIIEGKLERLEIKGLKYLSKSHVISLLDFEPLQVLNINSLREKLKILEQNAAIEGVKAELVKGLEPGNSVLLLEIEENSPINAGIEVNNYRSPGIGEFQGVVKSNYQNLVGVSDRLFGQYNFTEGFDAYSIGYSIPGIENKGAISLEYRNGDSEIIEDFEEVGIRAESNTISLEYRQPIIYRSDRELAFSLAFERQNSQTFILDDLPFSFTEGPVEGQSNISVLRLTGNWLQRSPSSVYTVSSQLNFGLDLFDATVNDNAADGLFFSWLGQAQWTKALNQNRDLLFVARLATQLTPDSLLPLEQFLLGGVGTVRGYRQNQEVGDNGVVGTIEIYIPLIDRASNHRLNLIPFFDWGTVWDNNSNEAEVLVSLGIGVNWKFQDFLSLRVDWGVPLVNTSDLGDSLQDNGFTFSFELQP